MKERKEKLKMWNKEASESWHGHVFIENIKRLNNKIFPINIKTRFSGRILDKIFPTEMISH